MRLIKKRSVGTGERLRVWSEKSRQGDTWSLGTGVREQSVLELRGSRSRTQPSFTKHLLCAKHCSEHLTVPFNPHIKPMRLGLFLAPFLQMKEVRHRGLSNLSTVTQPAGVEPRCQCPLA